MDGLSGMDDPLADGGDVTLDLTPIIDVVFLLLIFFIMATTFAMPVLDVVLPVAESAEPTEDQDTSLLLTIDHQGRIMHQDKELDRAALTLLLEADQEQPITLFVDERVSFEIFVMVMDQAKLARRTHVSITTQPRP